MYMLSLICYIPTIIEALSIIKSNGEVGAVFNPLFSVSVICRWAICIFLFALFLRNSARNTTIWNSSKMAIIGLSFIIIAQLARDAFFFSTSDAFETRVFFVVQRIAWIMGSLGSILIILSLFFIVRQCTLSSLSRFSGLCFIIVGTIDFIFSTLEFWGLIAILYYRFHQNDSFPYETISMLYFILDILWGVSLFLFFWGCSQKGQHLLSNKEEDNGGSGKVIAALTATGNFVLSFVVAIAVSAVVGVGPVMAVEFGWPWWALTMIFVVLIGGIIVSLGGAENTTSEVGYTFFQQFVKIGVPALVSSVVLLIVQWMESWNVDSFLGGVGVFLIAVIAIAVAAAVLRTALSMLLTFHPINIVNALVYAYLGFFTGVMMFTTCLEICPAASWLALLGFTGGFATGGEDPYAYDVNGRKAKRTGSNEFTTEDGTKYKKVQSGWGEDFKRE